MEVPYNDIQRATLKKVQAAMEEAGIPPEERYLYGAILTLNQIHGAQSEALNDPESTRRVVYEYDIAIHMLELNVRVLSQYVANGGKVQG